MELATRNQWLAAIRDAQREHDQKIRETLGQSLSHAKAKAGEIYEERVAAMKANVPELKKQGMRSAASVAAAFAMGTARGFAGDERLNLGGKVPVELLLGIGAHIAAGTVLAGTPAAMVAHGAADGLLGVTAAHFGRELGGWFARRQAAQPRAAAAGYAPYGYAALPPPREGNAAYAGTNAADRAMAEAIEIMRQNEQSPQGT
jgi:hypothetical protein